MSRGPLVVLGDALLDVDLEGGADRLCPDAPVPVVDVRREWRRPGGAGLAARLAGRSVSDVVLVTALGDDEAGTVLAGLLESEVDVVKLPLRGETPRKTRVRASGQSLVRLDHGDGRVGAGELGPQVFSLLRKASGVLVADYGRGVAAHPDIRSVLTEVATTVPVVWDPHPRGPAPILGATLLTPNESEATGLAGRTALPEALACALRDRWGSNGVAVTLGARGAVVAGPRGATMIPVPAGLRIRADGGSDTCGAGDRFASAAAAALYEGADVEDAVVAAVDAAARFVGAGAAASLSQAPRTALPALTAFELVARVRRRAGRVVATGGCFDLLHPGHVSLLCQARALGDALVVCVNSDDSVRALKGPGRPIVPAADRARLLAALEPVDAVAVFDEPSPALLLDRLAPDIWVKGGDYTEADLPEAEVVRRHGGEVVLVPLVDGYSTTRLVSAAKPRGAR